MVTYPDDPFLKDAEGAARFCRDLIKRKWKVDYGPAVYWSARWAAHWALRSKAYCEPCGKAIRAYQGSYVEMREAPEAAQKASA